MSHGTHVMDLIAADATGWIEIGVGFAAYFILSFLWWGPLMGGKWGKEMGINMDEKPDSATFAKAMGLQVLSTFLIAYVLWHTMMAFTMDTATASPGNTPGYIDMDVGTAMVGVFFTWIGFFVPMQLGRVAWEKASWTLFGINSAGHFIGLAGMGLAFAIL